MNTRIHTHARTHTHTHTQTETERERERERETFIKSFATNQLRDKISKSIKTTQTSTECHPLLLILLSAINVTNSLEDINKIYYVDIMTYEGLGDQRKYCQAYIFHKSKTKYLNFTFITGNGFPEAAITCRQGPE